MNFKKDSVADAVKSILQHNEETDVNDASEDDLTGQKKIKRKDDVGPEGNFKPSKVRFHAGPKNESIEEPLEKVLANTTPHSGIIKTVTGTQLHDANKERANKEKLRMKESVTLKGFKQRYEEHSIFEQMVNEVLSKDSSAGQWIHDFVHSDNPKFAGKSKAERKKQALAAYYAKQRNEEAEQVEEALKGNQKKIDKNHNGKIDAQDFKLLRKEDTVEEGVVDTLKKVAKKTAEVLGGPDDEGHKKDLQRKMGIPQTGKPSMAKQNEEVESLDEGKMDKMSLSHLWHAHAHHSYGADQGWGGGDGGKHSKHAATAIENHVRKHYGNKVADDMVSHSDNHVAHAEYVGGEAAKEVEHDAEKLRKKHNIKGNLYGMNEESVNEGWDDMLKSVKDKNKPQPNGGAGKKQGSRYGGGKQKDTPEQDDDKKKVNESKRPEDDSVPFAPPFSKVPAEITDKSGAKHTPMSRAHHLARLAMNRVKKDLGQKKGK